MAKIIIAGCGWFTPEPEDIGLVMVEAGFQVTEVVTADATGVATAGIYWARQHSLPQQTFKTEKKLHGENKRNAEMATYADGMVAWWDGHGRGTGDLIRKMISMEKPVWIEMIRPIPEEELAASV